jgi:pimeloyl-ACP methyl ester carboxylesterase
MFLKYFHRWSSVLLLAPGMVMANQSEPTIDWQACHPESGLPFLCGSVEVPLDYNAPEGEKLTLALIKLSATTGTGKIGSLFYNPGGPGNSGVDFLLGIGPSLPPEIREHFDVIGFDPRGIARSSPLVCFDSPIAVPPFFFPRNPDEEALKAQFDTNLAAACKTNGGSVLDHMSTANVARDLDLLRQAVGDSQLNYVGYSHGSFLGITYANLFPDKIRAMVLDGVVDPIAWSTGAGDEGSTLPVTTRLRIDEGAQATLNEFFRLCDQAGAEQCAFANEAASKFDVLVDHLRATPVHMIDPINGPFDLTYDRFIATVFSTLADSSEWPLLATVLSKIHDTISDGSQGAAIKAGIAFAALTVAAGEAPNPGDLTHAAQQYAVMCTDSINPDNHAAWSLAGEAADANVGVFGRLTTWQSSPCAVWQGNDPDRYLGPFTQMTTEPILIVGNRFDPITPYEGALQTHSLLPNSALLTLEGWGHTSLFLSSCVDQAVSSYLLTSRVASPEASCQQDVAPFTDTSAEEISSGTNTPTDPTSSGTNTPTDPTSSGTNTPTDPTSSDANTPTDPTSPGTNTPTDPTSPGTNTPTDPTSSGTNTPTEPTSSGTNTPTEPTSSGTNTPTEPTSSGTNTSAEPVSSGTNTPTEPVSSGSTSPKDDSVNANQEKVNPSGTEAPSVSKTFTTYDPATGTVTIPAVQVGDKVEFANVKLGFNPGGTLSVLSSEAPKTPVAASATYDPTIGTATISEVLVNGIVEFVNVKLKANPDGTFSVLATEKPSVAKTFTIYDPATGTVTIPAVQVGDKVEFANVKLEFNPGGTLSVLSSEAPQAPVAASAAYDSATGATTISEVLVNGIVEFINVKLKANPDGTFSVLATEKPPVS